MRETTKKDLLSSQKLVILKNCAEHPKTSVF